MKNLNLKSDIVIVIIIVVNIIVIMFVTIMLVSQKPTDASKFLYIFIFWANEKEYDAS